MMVQKDRVTGAFSRSAKTYDQASQVQEMVAVEVADQALSGALPSNPKILEIGCGTGALTRKLLDRVSDGSFYITDISADMIETCRGNINDPRLTFDVMDGEHPDEDAGTYDLIVSSLAFQWFTELQDGLARLSHLLAPGGRLVFSTLGDETFSEWRAAHHAFGLSSGIPKFNTGAELSSMWPSSGKGCVQERRIERPYADAKAFARALKVIGANTPALGHVPLSPGNFRRIAEHLGDNFTMTYHVLYGEFVKA